MPPPIPPPRESSKANNPELWSEWHSAEVKLKKSVKSLRERASTASMTKDLQSYRKLKMEELGEEREILRIEQKRLDAKCQDEEIEFATFRQLQDDVTTKMDEIMSERWQHNKELRDLEVAAGKEPELGPDLNHALEAIMFELYKSPGSNTRNKSVQSKMREEAFAAYASSLGAERADEARCTITGEYFMRPSLVCGHIVPRHLSEDLVGYLIGASPSRHINSRYNALIMCREAEARFDKGQFVLIPADETETPITRWKIWVLDHTALNGSLGRKKLRDYHDKEIFFNSSNRPAARFIFAHYAISIMRMTRSRVHNYEDRLRELAHLKPFATPGAYLRRTLAMTLWYNTMTFHLGNLPYQNIISDKALFDDPNTMTSIEEDEAARRILSAPSETTAEDDDDNEEDVFMALQKHL